MPSLVTILLETAWLYLPAMAANLAPVLALHYRWLPVLAVPIDTKRLGNHKTYRGIIFGIAAGALVGVLQFAVYRVPAAQALSLMSYGSLATAVLLGVWLAVGALAGDAVKSFLKRRAGVAPGRLWLPWDQIDFVIGASVVAVLFTDVTVRHLAVAVIVLGVGSFATSYLGVQLKIKTSL